MERAYVHVETLSEKLGSSVMMVFSICAISTVQEITLAGIVQGLLELSLLVSITPLMVIRSVQNSVMMEI